MPATANDKILTPSGEKDLFDAIPKWAPYAILVLTAVIYSRVVFNNFVNIDDDAFILNNQLIRHFNWDGIVGIFTNFQNGKYQPLVNFSFLLEYTSFGFNPVVFHIDNVLLHLASTWVIYKFTELLTGKRVTAVVVSVLFAVHPMHVEEVAWAAERKDVLYALFFLLSMLQYLKYIRSGFKWKYFIGMALFFLASIFSKTTAMTLPIVLLAIDWYEGRKLENRALIEKLPFIAIGIFFFIVGMYSQQSEGGSGAMPESIHLINRIFLFTSVPAFYVVKLIAPLDLSVMHYYPDVTNGLLPWPYYASLPLLLLVIWWVLKPSPVWKEKIFGALFFIITISVMEQIVAVGPSFTPERYTYIPYIGLFFIIGQWMANVETNKQKTVAIVFSLFLVFFCMQTFARIGVWKESDDVFKDVVKKNAAVENSYEFYFMRGSEEAGIGKIQEALRDYNQCIALNPVYAEAYTNRGAMYFQSGDYKSALYDFNKAIELKPKRAKAYNDRAALEATTGDFPAALKDYDHCLKLDSNNSQGYADRGMVYLSIGDTGSACKNWKKSLELGNKSAANLLNRFCH